MFIAKNEEEVLAQLNQRLFERVPYFDFGSSVPTSGLACKLQRFSGLFFKKMLAFCGSRTWTQMCARVWLTEALWLSRVSSLLAPQV